MFSHQDGARDRRYKMMREVVKRRYERVSAEKGPMPDLVLIDGGKGHLSAAKSQLDEMGLANQPILSIAKQHEIVFSPKRTDPYVLPPTSEVLKMIRHLRDEAHRFAISYHRRLHRKEALVSRLDGIRGLGPKAKERLLKKIGSVAKIQKASEEELIRTGGLAAPLAAEVRRRLEADH